MDKKSNAAKISWLLQTLGISVRQFSDVCRKSPSYVSRIIHGEHDLGSEEFYRTVEANIETILSLRTVSFMDMGNAVPLAQLEALEDGQSPAAKKVA